MFGARIRKRQHLWYGPEQPEVHGRYDCHRPLSRDDPDEAWHCCSFWPRKLSNKWNGREFAAREGVRLPELYWSGREIHEIPFDRLPDRYVVRATSGSKAHNVVVLRDGVDLLTNQKLDRDPLIARLHEFLARGFSHTLLLVEEFVTNETGQHVVPIGYKVHSFAGSVAAVQVNRRDEAGAQVTRLYSADWDPYDARFIPSRELGPPAERPACLNEMLAAASDVGRAVGTYIRVDMHATSRGALFNEFAPTPRQGRDFTDFFDRLLGDWWDRTRPDAL